MQLQHTQSDMKRLTRHYIDQITYFETEVRNMRNAFLIELRRIKSPDEQAKYRGNYTDDNCWKAFASDEFIRIVQDLSDMTDVNIGGLPPLLETPGTEQNQC